MWNCLCDCGNIIPVPIKRLQRGATNDCGCVRADKLERLRLEKIARNPNKGRSGTPEHDLWSAAKERATKFDLPFNIVLDDIVIPEYCPILGIKLQRGKGKQHGPSPSLDRVFPELGYVKGNIAVISHRANSLKQNATIENLESLLAYMKSFKQGELNNE